MTEATRFLPLKDAASLVGCPLQELLDAAAQDRLELFATVDGLLAWKAQRAVQIGPGAQAPTATPNGDRASTPPPPVPKAGVPLSLTLGPWEPIEDFDHVWPNNESERYTGAHQSVAQINGRTRVVVVGFTTRPSAGMQDRARAVVFFNSPPKQRTLVEFSGDANLASVQRYASPIKPRGAHAHLRPGSPAPEEYQGMPVDVFSDVVRGPYAANSLAVVADTHDTKTLLDTMARHGVIRGVYKEWL